MGCSWVALFTIRKPASKPFLALHLSIWNGSIKGCKRKKADPSFSFLNPCALLSYGRVSCCNVISLGSWSGNSWVLWKGGVRKRIGSLNLDTSLLSQLVKIFSVLWSSIPWKWRGTYFLSHSNTQRNQALRNAFRFCLIATNTRIIWFTDFCQM